MTIALTDRDRALIRAAWSLGTATHETLRQLVSPHTQPDTLRRRLRQLHRAGYLVQTRHVGPAGCLWLYSVGRCALRPGEPRPWRPSLAQLEHTLAVGETVVALTRPGFMAPLAITGWQGEAELRSWARPGSPYPDARLTWAAADLNGALLIEVDRSTESHTVWRRKLVRYLTARLQEPVFAVTTSWRRAAALVRLGADIGVHVVATTHDTTRGGPDLTVVAAGSVQPTRLELSRVPVRYWSRLDA